MKVSVAAERENITELFLTLTKHLVKYVKSFFHGFLNHCNFTETNYICLYSVFCFGFLCFFHYGNILLFFQYRYIIDWHLIIGRCVTCHNVMRSTC